MTDDPYASQTPGATLPPPDVSTTTPDVPIAPYVPTMDAPADTAPTADVPTQAPDAPPQPTDAAPAPVDAPNPNMVSLDVPIEVVDTGDGRKVEFIGDVHRLEGFVTQQGDNSYGFRGDCGLVSCKNVFCQFGVDATETSVASYAATHGICDMGKPGAPADQCGGTSTEGIAKILSDNGVPAHAWNHATADDIAGFVQEGRGVVLAVNAGILWNDANEDGNENHAVTVIGVVRDPTTQALVGFVLNDSGNGKAEVVGVDVMTQCFTQKGGDCVVTDKAASKAQQ